MNDLSLDAPEVPEGLFRRARKFIASRASFRAAVAFGITAVFSFPLGAAAAAALFLFSYAGGPTVFWTAIALLPGIALGVPTLVALFVARASKKRGETPVDIALSPPASAQLSRNAMAWVGALVIGPVVLAIAAGVAGEIWKRKYAAEQAKAARPIVVTDELGFCAPPVYGIQDGVPTVALTVRVPREESYALRIWARGHKKEQLFAWKDTVLAAGVSTVPLKTHVLDQRMDGPQVFEWPVVVTELSIRTEKLGAEMPPMWSDLRRSESIAVLQGPTAGTQ